MSNAHKPAYCRECGSTSVEWRQSKAGNWYLADLHDGVRAAVYSTGPHFKTCKAKEAELMASAQAEIMRRGEEARAKLAAMGY